RRPESDVEKVAGLVTTFIVKDCSLGPEGPDVMVTPGEGAVDFALVLAKLREGGFFGPLYVECVSPAGGVEGVERSLAHTLGYTRGILASLPLIGP
ncbi:MAG: hypothetical protein VX733_15675, partial [Candidatus Latescibacterota bacterium]|nr:hypothetical protein [Candidatus Latescibacterota bacterium]